MIKSFPATPLPGKGVTTVQPAQRALRRLSEIEPLPPWGGPAEAA